MSDDPTVTGPEEDAAPKRRGRADRAGKSKPPRQTFTVCLTDVLHFKANFDTQTVTVYLETESAERSQRGGEVREGPPKKMPPRVAEMPMGLFRDEEQYKDWAGRLYRAFHETLAEALHIAAADYMDLCGTFLLDRLGIEKTNMGEFIEQRALARARDTKRALHLTQKGRQRKWTAAELRRAVQLALDKIGNEQRFTLAELAKVLRADHGERAPKVGPKGKEGDSLGKLLGELDVDWKTLKRDAAARLAAFKNRKKSPPASFVKK